MKEIPLSLGKVALVDARDFKNLSQFKWHTAKRTGVFYAARGVTRSDGSVQIFLMHREILGLRHGDKFQADHKNGDGLDNRRSNLRIATKAQNAMNAKLQANNSSGYRGVSWRANRWDAYIFVSQRKIHIGRFITKELAAAARLQAAKHYFGEFARV